MGAQISLDPELALMVGISLKGWGWEQDYLTTALMEIESPKREGLGTRPGSLCPHGHPNPAPSWLKAMVASPS